MNERWGSLNPRASLTRVVEIIARGSRAPAFVLRTLLHVIVLKYPVTYSKIQAYSCCMIFALISEHALQIKKIQAYSCCGIFALISKHGLQIRKIQDYFLLHDFCPNFRAWVVIVKFEKDKTLCGTPKKASYILMIQQPSGHCFSVLRGSVL